jgi:predicted RNase H-like HicB family nuclease
VTTYSLYLESGPKHRKTMVHVLDLPGCVAVGPTTDEAIAAMPEGIRAFLRFLGRHGFSDSNGEPFDPGASFETVMAEHVTEGEWLGNGSPYVTFGPDFEPLDERDLEVLATRFGCLCEELAAWADTRSAEELDAAPVGGYGRTARAILLHVLGSIGGYLSAALGGAPGFSSLTTAAERGEVSLPDAMRGVAELAAERLRATTPAERAAVRTRPKDVRTLRKALRRMLEHTWEHLAELSRRPGGPAL